MCKKTPPLIAGVLLEKSQFVSPNERCYNFLIMRKVLFEFLELVRRLFSGKLSHSLPIVGKTYNLFYSYLKPNFVTTEGGIIYLDRGDVLGLLRNGGIVEEYEIRLFKKYIRPGDVVVDIGAHIGVFSLLFSKLVGNSGEVISFEPDTKTFSLLSKNIAINNVKNIRINQLAVSNQNEEISFYLYGSGQNSIGRLSESMPERGLSENVPIVHIEAISLDDFLGDARVDFIKMDIEGAEGSAFLGMKKILSKNNNVKILTEFNVPALRKASKISAEEFLEQLNNEGFRVYDIDEKSAELHEIINISEFIKRIGSNSAYLFCER